MLSGSGQHLGDALNSNDAVLDVARESRTGETPVSARRTLEFVEQQLPEPMEALSLRRGSTRLMARRTVPPVVLTWVLSAAARPVPADAIAAGHTLLTHELAVHGVRGSRAGTV
jgi:hypothetical protein